MKPRFLFIVIIFIFLFSLSLIRPVNYDEPYYTVSSQEILAGHLPYIDFLFHQPPLMIYLYSPVSDFGFWSLILGRFISVSLFIMSYFIFLKLIKPYLTDKLFNMFSIFYFLNFLVIDWVIIIKGYSLSVFLLSLTFLYYKKFLDNPNQQFNLFASSILSSMVVLIKLTYIIIPLAIFLYSAYFLLTNHHQSKFKYLFLSSLGTILPFLFFGLFYRGNYSYVYFDLIESNVLMNVKSLSLSLFRLFYVLIMPQNLILVLIILFSGFKYSYFEKFIILNILLYILIHLPAQFYPEYISSILPLIIVLALMRFSKFEDFATQKFKSVNNVKKVVFVLYLLSIPFSIIHLVHVIEKRNLVFNPIQMYSFIDKVNSLPGNKILSSWEGYSVYSKKEPLMKTGYVSAFINNSIDEQKAAKYKVNLRNEYKALITGKVPDIIIYDLNNLANIDGFEKEITDNYSEAFVYSDIKVYMKK